MTSRAPLTLQAPMNRRVVEAGKFVLRDGTGRVRAVLGAEPAGLAPTATIPSLFQPEGQYGLHFYGTDGAYRVGLREVPFNPNEAWELELQAKNTPTSARLLAGDSLASLSLNATEQSREVAEREDREWSKKFNTAKTGEEQLKILNRKWNGVQAALWAFPAGTSSLTLKHGLGGGLDFYLLKRRQSTLSITDENGVSRAVLGQTKLEYPATGVSEERPISSIVLFDKSGKVTWKAP